MFTYFGIILVGLLRGECIILSVAMLHVFRTELHSLFVCDCRFVRSELPRFSVVALMGVNHVRWFTLRFAHFPGSVRSQGRAD